MDLVRSDGQWPFSGLESFFSINLIGFLNYSPLLDFLSLDIRCTDSVHSPSPSLPLFIKSHTLLFYRVFSFIQRRTEVAVNFFFFCLNPQFLSQFLTVQRLLSAVLTSVSSCYWSPASVPGDQVLPVSHWLPMEAELRCMMGSYRGDMGMLLVWLLKQTFKKGNFHNEVDTLALLHKSFLNHIQKLFKPACVYTNNLYSHQQMWLIYAVPLARYSWNTGDPVGTSSLQKHFNTKYVNVSTETS